MSLKERMKMEHFDLGTNHRQSISRHKSYIACSLDVWPYPALALLVPVIVLGAEYYVGSLWYSLCFNNHIWLCNPLRQIKCSTTTSPLCLRSSASCR